MDLAIKLKRGRPFGPENAKFAIVPRHYGPCVYAVELSNGLVKLGYSCNARARLITLAGDVRRRFRADITRFHLGRPVGVGVRRVEDAIIADASQIGYALFGYREFFHGVTFDDAARIVDRHSEASA